MTTASSHLSKQLKELIKSIGQTKSKQEQDKIIQFQLTQLKPNLAQKNITPKKLKQYLIRAMYIEMLGHSAHFAHIHAINLTQNKNLILKKIGYLMCSLFFNRDSDLLIMLVATILKDLNSTDVHQVVICLTSLSNIMNNTIASGIIEAVLKLTTHATDLVRKKAILIMQKIKLTTDIQIPDYKQKLKKGLCDRQPSVMAATLNLYLQQIKQNPKKYRELTSSFVIILKQVIEHKLPKQFDYHRMPGPWIQIKLMKILQLLGKGDLKASQHCYTILQQALKRAEQTNNNIAFAITYQCVKTICSIYPNQSLVQEAALSLTKFLTAGSNNNLKHMGLRLLSQMYKQHPKLLDDYQLMIVECLQSKDQTLKQETLDLLYKMTSNENIQIIVTKMLDALHSSTDDFFRNSLVLKITQLCERFSPTHKWYLDTMQLLFELGSQYLNGQVLNNFLKLVVQNYQENDQFAQQIIQKMKQLFQKIVPTDFIIKAVSWVLGQIGSDYYNANEEKLQQLFQFLHKIFQCDVEDKQTKVWILDSLVKISSCKGFKNHSGMKITLQKYLTNGQISIYQRSLQSKKLAKYNAALKKAKQINFQEDLSFLNGFVQNSKLHGAKQYRKYRAKQHSQVQIRFTPYEPKTATNVTSPFATNIKKQEQKPKVVQKQERAPIVVIPPSEPKPKKPFVTPQQKAKKALAQNIFGSTTKGATTKPVPKGPEKKKQQPTNKVQTADLL